MQVLDPDKAGIRNVAMRQRSLFDTRVTDVKLLQFVIIHEVEDIQACGVVVVHRVILLVIGLLPIWVLEAGVSKPQVLFVVGIVPIGNRSTTT